MSRLPAAIAVSVLVLTACTGAAESRQPADDMAQAESATTAPAATSSTTTTASSTTSSTTTSSTTSSTMTTTTTTEPPRGRVVITGVGDTNLDPDYIATFRTEGYEYAFTGLQEVFLDDDLTVVNLECAATTTGRPLDKAFTFNCDLDALPVLRAAGVEVANLGNNHSGDYGEEALIETRNNVAAAGISPVGVGVNSAEAHRPALFDINGWSVAVLGFGGVVPWADWIATVDDPGMADGDDIESMAAAVRAADEVADLVFVTIHWGVELDTEPRPEDVERARAMIDAGADGIFGHHPHRLQPLEFYKGRPIAWSLGNFVWPRLSTAGATTAVAQFIVAPDGTLTACLIPTVIESHGHPVIQVDYQGLCRWD